MDNEQLLWFARALVEDQASMKDLHDLVRQYIHRHDEEIAHEASERRPGRPKSKQQERLEQSKDADQTAYASSGLGKCRLPTISTNINLMLLPVQSCQI